jgi:hypothetical protein
MGSSFFLLSSSGLAMTGRHADQPSTDKGIGDGSTRATLIP